MDPVAPARCAGRTDELSVWSSRGLRYRRLGGLGRPAATRQPACYPQDKGPAERVENPPISIHRFVSLHCSPEGFISPPRMLICSGPTPVPTEGFRDQVVNRTGQRHPRGSELKGRSRFVSARRNFRPRRVRRTRPRCSGSGHRSRGHNGPLLGSPHRGLGWRRRRLRMNSCGSGGMCTPPRVSDGSVELFADRSGL
jgi:hypothetical protein